jgi:glutaredoxin|tara:strand:- start:90 stop:254 length:165 start_codon:yes stop_codon:yes gene_type:complete
MLLDSKGETYEEININENQEAKEKLKELGFKTVPQIWLNEEHIGGYVELEKRYV